MNLQGKSVSTTAGGQPDEFLRRRQLALQSLVAMHCGNIEGWHTDCNVLCTVLCRSGVSYPLSRSRDDCLSGRDIDHTTLMFHAQCSPENDCVLGKVRPLPWFLPARRCTHVSDADLRRFRIYPADVFIDEFQRIAGGRDACGTLDQSWHSHLTRL